MKLKALTLNGFKSFADKTKIEFTDGLTGIVGPNGSGKSNIIDALRWVLGEQSAKSLRGDKMADIIFGGSESRASLNRAEVSIEFDNTDQTLKGLPESVVICRRLYRSGESEFLINNKNVRLRDISELFMDTGVSRNSFSIISQGKVESVFNSKPEDRRYLIEEAAGISKYKKEKLKARSELMETTDHLDRVADVIIELDKQREPLEKQASAAKDYLKQKKQYDHFKLSDLVLEIEELKEQVDTANGELRKTNHLFAKYDLQNKQQKETTNRLTKENEELEQKATLASKQLLELTRQKERMSGKQEMSQQERTFQKERLAELKEQLADNKSDLQESELRFNDLKNQVNDKENSLSQLQRQLKDLRNRQNTDPAQLASEIDDIRQQILKLVQNRSSLTSKLEYLQQEQEENLKVSKVQDDQLRSQKAELEQLIGQQDSLAIEMEQSKRKYTQIEDQATSVQNELSDSEKVYQQKKEQWYSASDIMHKAQTQLETLDRVSANYSGYYQGAKNVLQAKKQLSGVIGSVAELLELSPKFSTAIETALGGQLQNIVTVDENAAKRGIEYLNKKRLGRATFLPRNTVKPRHIATSAADKLANIVGVFGVASQLVKMGPDDQNVLNYLLGTTVIVSNLEVALQAAKVSNHAARIVTLKGEVINAGGSMSGGTGRQKHLGLLEQKRQYSHLRSDVQIMQQKLAELEVAGKKAADQRRQLRDKVDQLESQTVKAKDEYEAFAKKYAELSYIVKHKQTDYDNLRQALAKRDEQENKIAQQVSETKEQQAQTGSKINQLQSLLQEKQTATTAASDFQKKYEAQIVEIKQKVAVENERLDTLKIQLKEVENQKERLKELIEKQTTISHDLVEKNRLNDTSEQDLKTKLTEISKRIEETSSLQNELAANKAELKEKLSRESAKLQRVSQLQEATRDEQQQKQILLSRVNTLLDRNLSDLSEQYGMSYEYASQQEIERDAKQVKHQLKLLKLGLDDLGDVNLGSIKEFERISERYEFLQQQQTDLLTAKAQLESSMAEMDNEVKTRFKETFEKVAAAFAQVFPQIFEGGNAYLTLTDPSDLLQTGIEITAQPPGKKSQQLSLLSGGERTLTAIALLFAILQVSPVPFAVLDEAEAALDDANVARYSQYLRRLDHETQFIIITHRKGTMVQADVLYGVTMQDSGVSRMVSVSLEDVI